MIVTSCDLCEPGLKWSGFDRESGEVVKGELSVAVCFEFCSLPHE